MSPAELSDGFRLNINGRGNQTFRSKDEARAALINRVDEFLNARPARWNPNAINISVTRTWALGPSEFTLAVRELEAA